jgi:hypothetical protein
MLKFDIVSQTFCVVLRGDKMSMDAGPSPDCDGNDDDPRDLPSDDEKGFGGNRNLDAVRDGVAAAILQFKAEMAQQRQSNEATWETSASIYAVGCELAKNKEALKAFCSEHELNAIKSTLNNPFLPVTKAVFKSVGYQGADLCKDASKRARALKVLHEKKIPQEGAYEFLRSNGGIDGCLKLAPKKSRGTPVAAQPVVTAEAPTDEGTESAEDSFSISNKERSLIEAVRVCAAGAHTIQIKCDANGLMAFKVIPDVAEGSAALPPVSSEGDQEIAA